MLDSLFSLKLHASFLDYGNALAIRSLHWIDERFTFQEQHFVSQMEMFMNVLMFFKNV